MMLKKKYILITTFIVIAAILIVLCVGYFSRSQVQEFDGTLVESIEFPSLL